MLSVCLWFLLVVVFSSFFFFFGLASGEVLFKQCCFFTWTASRDALFILGPPPSYARPWRPPRSPKQQEPWERKTQNHTDPANTNKSLEPAHPPETHLVPGTGELRLLLWRPGSPHAVLLLVPSASGQARARQGCARRLRAGQEGCGIRPRGGKRNEGRPPGAVCCGTRGLHVIWHRAGAGGDRHTLLRDLNVHVDGLGIDVIANSLPLWGGACSLRLTRPSSRPWTQLRLARRAKERTYREILSIHRCLKLVAAGALRPRSLSACSSRALPHEHEADPGSRRRRRRSARKSGSKEPAREAARCHPLVRASKHGQGPPCNASPRWRVEPKIKETLASIAQSAR